MEFSGVAIAAIDISGLIRQCFIENLAYKLTLFLPDGTPVRAEIDSLTLKEVDEEKPSGSGQAKQPDKNTRETSQNMTTYKNKNR
ncbi:MAG: hypothetical protein AB4290_16345 [Spirulina sp.]